MVVIGARDLPGLRRFYRSLGWPERPGASDSLAMFELGGTVLTLHPDPLSDADAAAAGPARTHAALTMVIACDSGDVVDDAFRATVGVGAGVVSEPRDQPWGGRSAVVADPEGNRWELLYVPRAPG